MRGKPPVGFPVVAWVKSNPLLHSIKLVKATSHDDYHVGGSSSELVHSISAQLLFVCLNFFYEQSFVDG